MGGSEPTNFQSVIERPELCFLKGGGGEREREKVMGGSEPTNIQFVIESPSCVNFLRAGEGGKWAAGVSRGGLGAVLASRIH